MFKIFLRHKIARQKKTISIINFLHFPAKFTSMSFNRSPSVHVAEAANNEQVGWRKVPPIMSCCIKAPFLKDNTKAIWMSERFVNAKQRSSSRKKMKVEEKRAKKRTKHPTKFFAYFVMNQNALRHALERAMLVRW